MSSTSNIIRLADYRKSTMQETVDDISARAFLFLRDAAEAEGAPMHAVIAEHMLGMALVVEAVEGRESAQQLLDAIAARLG